MPFTLAAPCQYREDIRKSRFLALAAPVHSAEDAQAFIAAHREPAATHNCWAWKVGALYRFSDDGEPGGTAGRPILAAIEGQDCDRVAVLVIRWYGGIQLGTGGLARAYGGGAVKCLQAGERVELIARIALRCRCDFAELALVRQRLAEAGGVVEAERFLADGVELDFALAPHLLEAVQRQLAELSRGRIRVERR